METQHITLAKAKQLENSISWLSNLTPVEGVNMIVRNEDATVNLRFTPLINELAKINKRREEILKEFNKWEKQD